MNDGYDVSTVSVYAFILCDLNIGCGVFYVFIHNYTACNHFYTYSTSCSKSAAKARVSLSFVNTQQKTRGETAAWIMRFVLCLRLTDLSDKNATEGPPANEPDEGRPKNIGAH